MAKRRRAVAPTPPAVELADRPVANSWLSAQEWARLYRCARPAKFSLSVFQEAAQTGTLDGLTSQVVLKICRELRSIMTEHGWLNEMRLLPSSTCKKAEAMALIRQAVLMSVEASRAATFPPPNEATLADAARLDTQSSDSPPQPPPPPAATEHPNTATAARGDPSDASAPVPSSPSKGPAAPPPDDDESLLAQSPRQPHLRPLSSFVSTQTLGWSTVPPPRGNGGHSTLQRSVEAAAAALRPPAPSVPTSNACPSALSSALPKPPMPPQTPYGTPTALEMHSSPMSKILVVIKRFQLRMGSYPVRFEIPRQYLAEIAARRLRVHVVPMTGNQPSVWPKIKEVFVFVNERNVQASWKRFWPAKKSEVTKAFLPLDVTQYLLNPLHQIQRLQLDCFNHEYCGSFAVVLVAPRTEGDVMAEWRDTLTRSAADLQSFYESMMRVDNAADDEDVTCEVPTVSLKCPISQARMAVPVRGRLCRHLQCIDFAAFLRYCHISCYWNCPLCDLSMRLYDVVVDGPFLDMLNLPASAGWSHAQLVRNSDGPCGAQSLDRSFHWDQSEKHRSSALDLSSDEEENNTNGDEPPRHRRRLDGTVVGGEGVDGTGSAEEPICL